jgi:nucleotide-binding universal stress UspA family protein
MSMTDTLDRSGDTTTGNKGFRSILVPLDGSTLAEQALEPAETLAAAFGARITLVRATRPVQEIALQITPMDMPLTCDLQEIWEIEDTHTAQYLDRIAARLAPSGLTIDCVRRQGHPADVIHDVAEEIGADLIAITTHGHGGWRRVIFGSVAVETIRHAHCPVLVIHVSEPEKRKGSLARGSDGPAVA